MQQQHGHIKFHVIHYTSRIAILAVYNCASATVYGVNLNYIFYDENYIGNEVTLAYNKNTKNVDPIGNYKQSNKTHVNRRNLFNCRCC